MPQVTKAGDKAQDDQVAAQKARLLAAVEPETAEGREEDPDLAFACDGSPPNSRPSVGL
jgi:hypothetical protein